MKSQGTSLLLFIALAIGTVLVPSSGAVHAQESMHDLAQKFPGYVNAVMSVDADAIRNSRIAREKGWADTYEGKVSSGLIFIPERANSVLLGAAMDYQTFHPRTTAMLATTVNCPTEQVICEATQGTIDTMLDIPVVETANDSYIVRLDDNTIAAYRPAIRSDFLPWLNDLKQGKTNPVKDYLDEGLAYADLGTAIIAAFNLENVISRSNIYDNLRDNQEIVDAGLDAKEVSRLIASCRGFTLGVTTTDKVTGAIKIDFNEDISSLNPISRDVALGVLERVGLFVDDFSGWSVKMNDKQIQVTGGLSTESLRDLLSIVDAAPPQSTSFADSGAVESHSDDPGAATKQYFTAVNSMVDGAKTKVNAGSAYTSNAKWLRKYALKIEGLPTLNVDPEMIDYGLYTAETLRQGAMLLLDANAETKTKIQGLIASGARSGGGVGYNSPGGYGSRYGGRYGGGYYYNGYRRGSRSGRGTGQRLRDSTRANLKTEAIKSLQEMFIDFERETGQMLQSMNEKYGAGF